MDFLSITKCRHVDSGWTKGRLCSNFMLDLSRWGEGKRDAEPVFTLATLTVKISYGDSAISSCTLEYSVWKRCIERPPIPCLF